MKIKTIVTALFGAVVGAVATVLALKDKKTSDKVKEVLADIKGQVQDKKIEVEAKFVEGKEKIKKALKEVKAG